MILVLGGRRDVEVEGGARLEAGRRWSGLMLVLVCATQLGGVVSARENARLTAIEADQESVISTAMAAVESRLPKRQCVRYFACVGSSDPSPAIKARIHGAGYRAVRWCSEQGKVVVPERRKVARITVVSPIDESDRGQDLLFKVSGVLELSCRNRFDLGRPTTDVRCEPVPRTK